MKRQKANSLENIRWSKELTWFEGLLAHLLRSFEIVDLISDIARFTTRFEPVFKKKKKKVSGFLFTGWFNKQHRYSTCFAEILQNKLLVFLACSNRTFG